MKSVHVVNIVYIGASMTRSDEIAILRRIKLAGVPIECDEEARLGARGLRIEPLDDLMANHVIDVQRGGALYQAYLRVTCDVPGPIHINDVQLSVPWDDSIEFLSDPADGSGKPYYQLRNGDSFERHLCLNHRLFSSTAFRRGNCIEGFLLAEGMGQMPSSFRERSRVKVLFTIVDQFSETYSTELELPLERIEMPKARYRHRTESMLREYAMPESDAAVPAPSWHRGTPAAKYHENN